MKKARIARHIRVRKKVRGSDKSARLSVFRSNRHIYVQIIDDEAGKTIASFSDINLGKGKKNNVETAQAIGEELAKVASKKKINKIVFDRGGYKYHGKVKALAEGARKGGLVF